MLTKGSVSLPTEDKAYQGFSGLEKLWGFLNFRPPKRGWAGPCAVPLPLAKASWKGKGRWGTGGLPPARSFNKQGC